MALQAISQTWDAKNDYKFEDNYDHYCAYEITPDGNCRQVMKVKKDLTAYDIEQLDDQLDIEIDKAITSGSGFTKWQKFLDWFMPIWLLSFAATALTYAMDSDVRSLFNKIGYDALVALGFIKPVTSPTEVTPFKEVVLEPVDTQQPASFYTETRTTTSSGTGLAVGSNKQVVIPSSDVIVVSDVTLAPTPRNWESYTLELDVKPLLQVRMFPQDVVASKVIYGDVISVTMAIDGVTKQVLTTPTIDDASIESFHYETTEFDLPMQTQKVTKTQTRLPYKLGEYYYTDFIAKTNDGHDYEVQLKSTQYNKPTNYTALFIGPKLYSGSGITSHKMTAIFNQSPYKKVLPPLYEEIETVLDPASKSTYMHEDGTHVALIPSSGVPYTDSTGTVLTPTVQGEEVIFTKPDGTIVPDDQVVVGEPNVTVTPEGVPQVTPAPTEANPSPQPIPLVPTIPTDPPPPPPDPPPPPEDGGSGKPNIPLSLLLGLFKLLFAIIFYLIRMFTFIVTIQFIEPIPIPNPYFIWFTTAEILGVQPYPLVKNIALFFLSFSIYKSIRRVFG